jgi:hypothetical protein
VIAEKGRWYMQVGNHENLSRVLLARDLFFPLKERIGDEGFIIPASLGDYLDKVSYENLEGSKTRFLGSSEGIAVVDVQAMISMDELVDALLPLNLLPLVVPEFKGITVGGSIQGSSPLIMYVHSSKYITSFNSL